MENLTVVAEQRAERLKNHKYTTPLPFDAVADSRRPASTAVAQKTTLNHTADQPNVNIHRSDNSSSSNPSQASTDPTSYLESSRGSTDAQQPVRTPKHVPLYQLIDFRVSRSRQPTSQDARPPPSDDRQLGPQHGRVPVGKQHATQRIVRDGVPHLMTRDSTVLVESVDGVALTSTWKPQANPENGFNIPETEAEEIRGIESPTETDDLNLQSEFEHYQRHYARPPPSVWHGPQNDEPETYRIGGRRRAREPEGALWTKRGWEQRTRQISPRPVNRGIDHTFVDGYSNATPVTGRDKEDSRRDWASSHGHDGLGYRAPGLPSERRTVQAAGVPSLRR